MENQNNVVNETVEVKAEGGAVETDTVEVKEEKTFTQAELDKIQGIGQVKKQLLLKRFGSVENIKNAEIQELLQIKGITEKLANKIKFELNK